MSNPNPEMPHEKNTERKVETAVGDSKYGTIENYLVRQQTVKTGHHSVRYSIVRPVRVI
jgi:hypothetical protein